MIKKILIIFASFCAINVTASQSSSSPKTSHQLLNDLINRRLKAATPPSSFRPVSSSRLTRSSSRSNLSLPSCKEDDEEEEKRPASAPALSRLAELKQQLMKVSREDDSTPTFTDEDIEQLFTTNYKNTDKTLDEVYQDKIDAIEAKITELQALPSWKTRQRNSRTERNVVGRKISWPKENVVTKELVFETPQDSDNDEESNECSCSSTAPSPQSMSFSDLRGLIDYESTEYKEIVCDLEDSIFTDPTCIKETAERIYIEQYILNK